MQHEAGFYQELLDTISDGVYFVDRRRSITYWNQGAERLTGYRAAQVVGRLCRDGILNHVDTDGTQLCGRACPLRATIHDGRRREAHVYMHHADGHRQPVWVRAAPLYDADGRIVGAVEVFSDDTAGADARAKLEELQQQALTDPLTQLGNRRYLQLQLEARLGEWRRHEIPFAVLMVDIDRFKTVNDTHGHDAGDQTLAMVARTLSFALRGSDTVARYGGEEFLAVLTRPTPDRVAGVAERLRHLVAASQLVIGRHPIQVTVSIGAAIVTPADDITTLIRRADLAVYAAKQAGRNRVHHDPGHQGTDPLDHDRHDPGTGHLGQDDEPVLPSPTPQPA